MCRRRLLADGRCGYYDDMRFVHFVMDMQGAESENFLLEDWDRLCAVICEARSALSDSHVTTVHVGLGPVETGVLPYEAFCEHVHARTGVDAAKSYEYRFHVTPGPHDLTVYKNRSERQFSANTPSINRFLDAEQPDALIFSGVWEREFFDHLGILRPPLDACLSVSAMDFAARYPVYVVSEATNYDHDTRRGVLRQRLSPEKRASGWQHVGVTLAPLRDMVALVAQNRPQPVQLAS